MKWQQRAKERSRNNGKKVSPCISEACSLCRRHSDWSCGSKASRKQLRSSFYVFWATSHETQVNCAWRLDVRLDVATWVVFLVTSVLVVVKRLPSKTSHLSKLIPNASLRSKMEVWTLNETVSNLEPTLGWEGAWLQKNVLTMVGSGASGTHVWCIGCFNWK